LRILRLVNVGLAAGHFDLIVIDEAGQAMEPEIVAVLAPLKIPQVNFFLTSFPFHLQFFAIAIFFISTIISGGVWRRSETAGSCDSFAGG